LAELGRNRDVAVVVRQQCWTKVSLLSAGELVGGVDEIPLLFVQVVAGRHNPAQMTEYCSKHYEPSWWALLSVGV
jgi:hypothetical protein